jgi:uncharacterized membrane protein YgcG
MNTLSPAEFSFLDRPYWVDDAQMIKLCLQEMCLTKMLTVSRRLVVVNAHDKKSYPRYFFSIGPQFLELDKSSECQTLLGSLFADKAEMKFLELRNRLLAALFNKVENFSRYYLRPDMERKGLIQLRYFKTRQGSLSHQQVCRLLDETDKHIDFMLKKDKDELLRNLQQLGTCVLLLEEPTIKKLKVVSKDVEAIRKMDFMSILNSSFDSFDSYFYMSSFAFDSSGADGDYSGGGDFSGFGGGDGGGAGGGGDW